MKDAYYFVIRLTEGEHEIVSEDIKNYCENTENGVEFKYYRKFKTGHEPMFRECKVRGNRKCIAKFKQFLDDNKISDYIHENYWLEQKKLRQQWITRLTEEELNWYKEKCGKELKV